MLKHLRRLLAATLIVTPLISASAQTQQQTSTSKFADRFDAELGAVGFINKSVTGNINVPVLPANTITQNGSTTAGVNFTLRASKSQYVGAEFNFVYARFTQTYNSPLAAGSNNCCNPTLSLQNNAEEFTFGYLVKPNREFFLGSHPYASAGAGTTAFRPTKNGGQGLQTQARMTYYYHVGLDIPAFGPNFGIRAGFRQLFYLAPDFGQNFITIKKHTITSEPVIGFYYHF